MTDKKKPTKEINKPDGVIEVKNKNMLLWESVCKTNTSTTKGAKIGQMNITAICPQSQRKKATETFGPYGIGWGIEVESENYSFMDIGETKLCTYRAILYFWFNGSLGRIPITANIKVSYKTQGNNGYLKIDDEYSKKVQTNALTKGLSALGFNSDVFEGKFDDEKYVQSLKQEEAGDQTKEEKPIRDFTSELAELNLTKEELITIMLPKIKGEMIACETLAARQAMIDGEKDAPYWKHVLNLANEMFSKKQMLEINNLAKDITWKI